MADHLLIDLSPLVEYHIRSLRLRRFVRATLSTAFEAKS